MSRWVICYDIANNHRRRRLRSLLKRYGDPVQESVFEVSLQPAALRQLRGRIEAVLDADEDRITFYDLASGAPPPRLVVT